MEEKDKEDKDKEDKDKEGGDGVDDKKDDKKESDEKPDEQMAINVEELDPFSVENVCDIGNGEPLFANFTWEDWILLSLRFEMHLLVHAYRKDVDDPQRTSFHESHLSFYYNKYFRKQFNLKSYGVSTVLELLAIIKDTIEVTPKNSILDAQLSDDTPLDNFVKLTEDHRRERERMYDAGDESVVLKFQKPPPRGQQYEQQGTRGGYPSRAPPQAQ